MIHQQGSKILLFSYIVDIYLNSKLEHRIVILKKFNLNIVILKKNSDIHISLFQKQTPKTAGQSFLAASMYKIFPKFFDIA